MMWTMKSTQDSQWSSWDLNWTSSEFKSKELPLSSLFSITVQEWSQIEIKSNKGKWSKELNLFYKTKSLALMMRKNDFISAIPDLHDKLISKPVSYVVIRNTSDNLYIYIYKGYTLVIQRKYGKFVFIILYSKNCHTVLTIHIHQ